MTNTIGKLQRVPLRTVWKHEAYDFTQWLQENLDILNDALDLELVSAEREQAAGSFSIDLVAESSDSNTYIVENQLEKSNHDHLGKVITYLTSREARGAIWIVSEPRQEHVNAMAWLNESSSADFYLVKVEAVKIGESDPAPLLTLIVGPSIEAKESGIAKQEKVERHFIRKKWWTKVVANPLAKSHSHISPSMSSWIATSSGIRGLDLNYVTNKNSCGAELYIDRGKDSQEENKRLFDQLKKHQTQIDSSISAFVNWQRLDTRRACRIRIDLPGGYRSPEEEWTQIQEKMINVMNELEEALKPALKALKENT